MGRGRVSRRSHAREEAASEVRHKKKVSNKALAAEVLSASKSEFFRKTFTMIDEGETLIVDFSGALHRDLILHGRIYLSQGWFCFYANIFGYETTIAVRWKDIDSISPSKTAFVIPNAIEVRTANEKYLIGSLTSRKKAYTLMFWIWQNALLGYPKNAEELIVSCHYYQRNLTFGCEFLDAEETGNDVVEGDDSSVDKESTAGSMDTAPFPDSSFKPSGSDSEDQTCDKPVVSKKKIYRKGTSRLNLSESSTKDGHLAPEPSLRTTSGTNDLLSVAGTVLKQQLKVKDTSCACGSHFDFLLIDKIYPLSVDDLFNKLFTYPSKEISEIHRKNNIQDVRYEAMVQKPDGSCSRKVSYVYPVKVNIGPKTCKTIFNQMFSANNEPGKRYSVVDEASFENIPYGDSFIYSTQYCLLAKENNCCRLRMHGKLQFVKNIWGIFKNIIMKSTLDSSQEYAKSVDLVLSMDLLRISTTSVGTSSESSTESCMDSGSAPQLEMAQPLSMDLVKEKLPDVKVKDRSLSLAGTTAHSLIAPSWDQSLQQTGAILLVLIFVGSVLYLSKFPSFLYPSSTSTLSCQATSPCLHRQISCKSLAVLAEELEQLTRSIRSILSEEGC